MSDLIQAVRPPSFEVHVSKDTFKFNAAHFVAYPGFRERLHGHNYKVAVRLKGSRKIGPDGYVIDFGNIKEVAKKICKSLNEHFLCPIYSDVIKVEEVQKDQQLSVKLTCEDGATFLFPKSDCAMLPIVHATTEELAIYLYGEIVNSLGNSHLRSRGIHTLSVNVSEAPGQDATFTMGIPEGEIEPGLFDARSYIMKGGVLPMPCLEKKKRKAEDDAASCNGADCQHCQANMSSKLQKLAEAINGGSLVAKEVTPNDLKKIVEE